MRCYARSHGVCRTTAQAAARDGLSDCKARGFKSVGAGPLASGFGGCYASTTALKTPMSGHRTRQTRGFFVPSVSAGSWLIQDRFAGNTPRRLIAVFSTRRPSLDGRQSLTPEEKTVTTKTKPPSVRPKARPIASALYKRFMSLSCRLQALSGSWVTAVTCLWQLAGRLLSYETTKEVAQHSFDSAFQDLECWSAVRGAHPEGGAIMSKVTAARTEASPDEESRAFDLHGRDRTKLTQAEGICTLICGAERQGQSNIGFGCRPQRILSRAWKKALDELRDMASRSTPEEGGAIMSKARTGSYSRKSTMDSLRMMQVGSYQRSNA